jgi:hypothetical protein
VDYSYLEALMNPFGTNPSDPMEDVLAMQSYPTPGREFDDSINTSGCTGTGGCSNTSSCNGTTGCWNTGGCSNTYGCSGPVPTPGQNEQTAS